MKKYILSQPECSKCKTLAEQVPDAVVIELDQTLLLSLARALNIASLPIVVLSGDITELMDHMK